MAGPVFILVLAMALAAFLTAMWNAGQAVAETGPTRAKHLIIAGLVTLLLAGVGLGAPALIIRLAGAMLAVTALLLAMEAPGRARIYSLAQCIFGGVTAVGLPFLAA